MEGLESVWSSFTNGDNSWSLARSGCLLDTFLKADPKHSLEMIKVLVRANYL